MGILTYLRKGPIHLLRRRRGGGGLKRGIFMKNCEPELERLSIHQGAAVAP